MDPITIGLMAGGAGASWYGNARQAKKEKMANIAAAEQTRWSPWTQMGAGSLSMKAGDPWVGAMQGAMGGAKTGASISNMMADTNIKNAEAEAVGKGYYPGYYAPRRSLGVEPMQSAFNPYATLEG